MEQFNETGLVSVLGNEVEEYDYNRIIAMAEQAQRRVDALNKIMSAAIRITTYLDWCLISGVPYLQETGATKVARLFGISWRILEVNKSIDESYPSFVYRMAFSMGGNTIECEGSRAGKDEFFTGKRTDKDGNAKKYKKADEIDENDVRKAAYTNCLNNGIKRLIPGLRNLDIATLKNEGIDINKIRGYTFKEGAQGGSKGTAQESGLKCAICGEAITQKVASFSQGKFGRALCMTCQKNPDAPAQVARPSAVRDNEDSWIPPEEPNGGR